MMRGDEVRAAFLHYFEQHGTTAGQKGVGDCVAKKFLGTAEMSTEQKVALVEEAQQTYGLNRALAIVGLPKSSWYYHQKQKVAYQDKYADLLPVLEEIARKHPEYGVPRIMPELREEYDIETNHKVEDMGLGHPAQHSPPQAQ